MAVAIKDTEDIKVLHFMHVKLYSFLPHVYETLIEHTTAIYLEDKKQELTLGAVKIDIWT